MASTLSAIGDNLVTNGTFASWPSSPTVPNGDFTNWPSGLISTTEGNFNNWFGTVISTNSTFTGWTSSSLTVANSNFSSWGAGTESLTNGDFTATSPGGGFGSDLFGGAYDFSSQPIGQPSTTWFGNDDDSWASLGSSPDTYLPHIIASPSGHGYNVLKCGRGTNGQYQWTGDWANLNPPPILANVYTNPNVDLDRSPTGQFGEAVYRMEVRLEVAPEDSRMPYEMPSYSDNYLLGYPYRYHWSIFGTGLNDKHTNYNIPEDGGSMMFGGIYFDGQYDTNGFNWQNQIPDGSAPFVNVVSDGEIQFGGQYGTELISKPTTVDEPWVYEWDEEKVLQNVLGNPGPGYDRSAGWWAFGVSSIALKGEYQVSGQTVFERTHYCVLLRSVTLHKQVPSVDDWTITGNVGGDNIWQETVGEMRIVTDDAATHSLAMEQDPSSIVDSQNCEFTYTVSASNSATGLSLYMDTTKLADLDCSVGTHSVDVYWSGTGGEKLRVVCEEGNRDISLSSVSLKKYSDTAGIYPTSWAVAGEGPEGNYIYESSGGGEAVLSNSSASTSPIALSQSSFFTSGRLIKLGYKVVESPDGLPLMLWSSASPGSGNQRGSSSGSVGTQERWVYVEWTPLVIGTEGTASGSLTIDDITALEYATAGPTDWTLGGEGYDHNFYPVTNGLGVTKGSTSDSPKIEQSSILTSGTLHTVKYTVAADSLGNALAGQLQVQTGSSTWEDIASTAGEQSHGFTPSGITTFAMRLKSSEAAYMTVTNVEIAKADRPDGWTVNISGSASVSEASSTLRFQKSGGETCSIQQTGELAASTVYKIAYDITAHTSGTFQAQTDTSTFKDLTSTVGSHVGYFKTASGFDDLVIGGKASAAGDFNIDNIQVTPLTGPTEWVLAGTAEDDDYIQENSGAAQFVGGTSGGVGIQNEELLTNLTMYRLNYTVVANPGGQSDALYWFIRDGVDSVVYTLDSSSTGAKQTIGVCLKSSGLQDSKIVWDASVATNVDITIDDVSIEILDPPTDWDTENGGMYEPSSGVWLAGEWLENDGNAVRVHTRGSGAEAFKLKTDSSIAISGKRYRLYLTVKENLGGNAAPLIWQAGTTDVDIAGSPGTSHYDATIVGSSLPLTLKVRTSASSPIDITIDDMELRELTATVTLPNPKFGNLESPRRLQTAGETLDGGMVVYDKGKGKRHYKFDWDNLSTEEANNLSQFIEDLNGMRGVFEMTFDDWRPTVFGGGSGSILLDNLRLESPDIELRETRNGLFSATLVAREG